MKQKAIALEIYWFCRSCWQRGIGSITIVRTYKDLQDGIIEPTKEEIAAMASLCHTNTNCKNSDVRGYLDKRK